MQILSPAGGGSPALPNPASPSFAFSGVDVAADLAVSADGRTLTRDATNNNNIRGCRGTVGLSSGLVMASFWSGADGTAWSGSAGVGFAVAGFSLTTDPSTSQDVVFWYSSGLVFKNNSNIGTIDRYVAGDQLDLVLDHTNATIFGRVNRRYWNANSSGNPATNTNGISISGMTAGAKYPYVCLTLSGMVCRSEFVLAHPTPPGSVTYPWS